MQVVSYKSVSADLPAVSADLPAESSWTTIDVGGNTMDYPRMAVLLDSFTQKTVDGQ